MNVALNGQPKQLTETMTVAELLNDLGVEPVRVAVEINETLIPRKTFSQAAIAEGDRIEIVTFVGGG